MKMMKETYQVPITQILIANLPIGCFASESKQVDPQAPAPAHPAPGHSAWLLYVNDIRKRKFEWIYAFFVKLFAYMQEKCADFWKNAHFYV